MEVPGRNQGSLSHRMHNTPLRHMPTGILTMTRNAATPQLLSVVKHDESLMRTPSFAAAASQQYRCLTGRPPLLPDPRRIVGRPATRAEP